MKEYRQTRNAIAKVRIHFVWIVRRKTPVLVGDVATFLKKQLAGAAVEMDSVVLNSSIKPEYVHLYLDCPPHLSPDQIMFGIKTRTAQTLKNEFPDKFGSLPSVWTREYFCSTDEKLSSEQVTQFLSGQKRR